MDPARKRKVRFAVALSVALVLAAALVYTSFSASSEARTPSQLLAGANPGEVYQLTGKVEPGYERRGTVTHFRIRDRAGTASVAVAYDGSLPDPFRAGREVIVDVRKQGDGFVGEKGSLITKCPSKFTAEQSKT
jgi:cytochrome c-type biogenesis protein CcmE